MRGHSTQSSEGLRPDVKESELGKGISSIDTKNDLCVIQFWVVGTGKNDAPVMNLSSRQLAEGHVVGFLYIRL